MNKVELVNNKLVVTLQDEDFPYICRICLGWRHLKAFREQPHLLNIFENMTNIMVTSNVNLPQNICVQCVNKLEDISKFIITSKKNETMLQEMLTDKATKNLLELTNSHPEKTNVPENVCSVTSSVPLIHQDESHQYVETTSEIMPPYLEVNCTVKNENQLNTNLCQDIFKMENDFEIEAEEISPESIGNNFIKTEDFEVESNASSDSSWRPDSSLCDNFEDAQMDEYVSKSSTCNNSIEIEAEKANIKMIEECIKDSPDPIDLKDMAPTKKAGPIRQTWDKESMANAILAVRNNEMSFLKAAKTYNVPKTTLRRLSKKNNLPMETVTNIKLGRKAVLPPDLETELVGYILEMDKCGFGLTRRDIKTLAYQLATRNNLSHTFSQTKKSAGKTWLHSFLARHPRLTILHPTGTSVARMKGFNKEDINAFYDLLQKDMDEVNYAASNIFNVDETGISVVPSRMPEVLSLKGKKQIAAVTSAEEGSTVTCVLCMNAAGSFVPPMMIYPRERDHPQLMHGAPPGTIHACHPSGCIQLELFTTWFRHFLKYVKPSALSPVLLILDGHLSHTRNIEVIDLARENHVKLLSIPPHSSHKIQPLDKTFMGPLKKYLTEEIRVQMHANAQAITQYDIAALFGRAYIRAQCAELAINGFRATGIYPLDRNVFKDYE